MSSASQSLPLSKEEMRLVKKFAFWGTVKYALGNSSVVTKCISHAYYHKVEPKMGVPEPRRMPLAEARFQKLAKRIEPAKKVVENFAGAVGAEFESAEPATNPAQEPLQNEALPIVPKPKLVNYTIEEHTTPKTNKAHDYWYSLKTQEKMKYLNSRNKLYDVPGFERHWDIRLEHPTQKGKYLSFVTTKCRLPDSKERFHLVQTTYGHGYHRNNAPIAERGYGAGVTKVIHSGKAVVWTGASDNYHVFFDCHPSPFALVPFTASSQVKSTRWDNVLMLQLKPRIVEWEDRPWKMVDLSGSNSSRRAKYEELINDPNYIMERKYDGGFYWLVIDKPKDIHHDYPQVSVISRRPKHVDGKVVRTDTGFEGIDKSWNMLHVKFGDIPRKYYTNGPTVIAVEVYAAGTGGSEWAKPLDYSTSVLNSHPVLAEQLQEKHGKLRMKVLDIKRVDGQYILNRKYVDKMPIVDQMHKEMPFLHVPKHATTKNAKLNLRRMEQEREFGEGVVFKHRHEEGLKLVYKDKNKETFDLRIIGIKPVEATSENSKWFVGNQPIGAGVFILENGQPVKITTDAMKIDAWKNPENYIDSYAEVEGMSQSTETNKVRAPILIRVRSDK